VHARHDAAPHMAKSCQRAAARCCASDGRRAKMPRVRSQYARWRTAVCRSASYHGCRVGLSRRRRAAQPCRRGTGEFTTRYTIKRDAADAFLQRTTSARYIYARQVIRRSAFKPAASQTRGRCAGRELLRRLRSRPRARLRHAYTAPARRVPASSRNMRSA